MKTYYNVVIILCLELLSISLPAIAQTGSSNIPVTPANIPQQAGYDHIHNIPSTLKKNYVRTWIPDEPTATQVSNIRHRQSTEYFDGLGRPLQTVQMKGHADGYDIIQHHLYDALGRESVQFLPFTGQLTSYGNFDYYIKTRIEQFYPPADGQHPYSTTLFDNSPLNRPVKQMAPGKSWVGSSRGRELLYMANGDKTYLFNAVNPVYYVVKSSFPRFSVGNGGALQYEGNYTDGQLFINREIDEDGGISDEIKDKLGRTVARRQLGKAVSAPIYPALAPKEMFPVNYLYTFYVYDDLGRLRFVLPPGASTPQLSVNNSSNGTTTTYTFEYSWTVPSTDQLAGICYTYLYDDRGRPVEKKVPGKAVEYMVYDSRDRMVLSQDGNLRAQGKWMMTVHDALNRPVINALVNCAEGPVTVAEFVKTPGVYSAPDWRYYAAQNDLFHSYPASITGAFILGYTYYDNYAELSGLSYDASKMPLLPANEAGVVSSNLSSAVNGMKTGTKVRVLHPDDISLSSQWLQSAIYYDAKGRPIQEQRPNLMGGTDVTGTLYYFQGKPYSNSVWHSNPSAVALPATTAALTNIKLDKTYRRNFSTEGGNDLVWNIRQSINDGTPFDLAYYDYNHLSAPVIKQFAATDILHEYNTRGWLNHIQARKSANHDVNYFNETVHYDDGFANKLYNGNIAGITWKYYDSLGSGANNAYGYSYDKLNRLTHAEYRERVNGGSWLNSQRDYTASNISYDDRGNIETMNQRGNISGPVDMDLLTYNYADHSNQLIRVNDIITGSATGSLPDFKDGANLSIEYSYDENGNLTQDHNKGLTIYYNYLNKPAKIVVAGKGTIRYVYDATGARLQKSVYDQVAGTTELWDYIGDFVYKDSKLQYILNEEGRCRPQAVVSGPQAGATKFVYDYFIKDHLGNVRSTVSAQPISQQYLALHEIATASSEQLIFDNIAAVRDDKPGSINLSDSKAAHLVAGDPSRRIGTAIMLRVMPGDKFTFGADSYYESDETETTETPAAEDVVNSLVTALTGGTVGGMPVGEAEGHVDIVNQALGNPEVMDFIHNQMDQQQNTNGPKAGLNYLFFNQDFQLLPALSGKLSITAVPGIFSNIGTSSGIMSEPGYVVVFVDNNSIGTDVWFDNVLVSHYSGQVLEENHYYPYGLTLSEQAAGAGEQPYKYQGIGLERHFGLETYETFYRGLDPQLGRFNQVDPKAEIFHFASPYASMGNNPVSFIDPLGDENTLYMVNLPNSGISNKEMANIIESVNATFSELGLEINATLYKGEGPLNMKNLDNTDGVALFGQADAVAEYANTNLGANFPEAGWGGADNPEKTQGNIIGISSTSLDASGEKHNSDRKSMASFATLHGAGHIAKGKGHAYDDGSALLWEGGRVMGNLKGGSYSLEGAGFGYFEKNPNINNVNDLKVPSLNQNYKKTMKSYFNSPQAKDNYQKRSNYRKMGLPSSLIVERIFGL